MRIPGRIGWTVVAGQTRALNGGTVLAEDSISAYASSNLFFHNITISGCTNDILFRNNPTPAFGAATNLIVWGNINNVVITNTSTLDLTFSDIQGTNFPGSGNISSDPLFTDLAGADFRLRPGSPALGTGLGGATMGASFPVGGIPSEPHDLTATLIAPNQLALHWQDTADNETGFLVDASNDGATWERVAEPAFNTTSLILSGSLAHNYFRIKSINGSGQSPWSNLAFPYRLTPAFTSIIQLSASEFRLSFRALAHHSYTVQYRDSLSSGTWQNLQTVPAENLERDLTVLDTVPADLPTRFYRLVTP